MTYLPNMPIHPGSHDMGCGDVPHAELAVLRAGVHVRDLALDRIKQGLCVFDGQHRLTLFNARYAEMYNLAPEDLRIGMTFREVIDLRFAAGTGPDMTPEQYALWRERATDKVTETTVELRTGVVHEIHHEPMPDGGWVSTLDDITERCQNQAQIKRLAHYDTLTDLPNRTLFEDRLQQCIDRMRRQGDFLAVLFLDLDRFKDINDTLGHVAGDTLLRLACDRIKAVLRQSDTMARLGGDEFAIILTDLCQPDEAAALASRIIQAMAEPFLINGQDVTMGTSIGITVGRPLDESINPGLMLRSADIALNGAKSDGRGRYRFFQAEMEERLQSRRVLERDLRRALDEQQIEVHYQPQVDLTTGTVMGVEALVRWRHPERGMISPMDFIPLAEECGLIGALGKWVLRTACADATRWPKIKLAVNLSPLQFRCKNLSYGVGQVLRETGLPPERLDLEITEGTLLQDTESTMATLRRIKDQGVGIALDDFGTGYSSLSYLRRFPFDKLKIDRSFVSSVAQDQSAAAIVQAIATLGRNLHMRVNAEGIETEAQMHKLHDLGCDEAQGYLLGRPMPRHVLESGSIEF